MGVVKYFELVGIIGHSINAKETDLFKETKKKNFFRFVDVLADFLYFAVMQMNGKIYGKSFILTMLFIFGLIKTIKKGFILGKETSEINRFERSFNAKLIYLLY